MTILELLYHILAIVVGATILMSEHGNEFEDPSLKHMANTAIKTVGLLLIVGGMFHLVGMTLLLPKP